jgi:hypothetical protein
MRMVGMTAAGNRGLTRSVAAALVLFASSVSAGNDVGGRSEPAGLEAVRRLLTDLGPRAAVERLAADSVAFYAFLRAVAEARDESLDVAVQLVAASDGYAKDSLVEALSAALLRKPEAVLVRGTSGIPLPEVCAYDPFTPISSNRTRQQFLAALQPRERAVAGVNRLDLARPKQLCLGALAQLKANVPARYTP